MTALDLRLEIAHQIESIPDSEQTLLKVLNYLRRITLTDKSVVLTGDCLRIWQRLEELKVLPQGWDGADAMPIEKKVIGNLQKVITSGVSADFRDWVLFPDEAGTLLLQHRHGNASISIGNHSFSYLYEKDGLFCSGDKVRFSPSSLLTVLRKISE